MLAWPGARESRRVTTIRAMRRGLLDPDPIHYRERGPMSPLGCSSRIPPEKGVNLPLTGPHSYILPGPLETRKPSSPI